MIRVLVLILIAVGISIVVTASLVPSAQAFEVTHDFCAEHGMPFCLPPLNEPCIPDEVAQTLP
jgi:hypothetical protein